MTIDAIGTQRAIAGQIVEQGGRDVLPVKDHQKALAENLESVMTDLVLSHKKKMPHRWTTTNRPRRGMGRRTIHA